MGVVLTALASTGTLCGTPRVGWGRVRMIFFHGPLFSTTYKRLIADFARVPRGRAWAAGPRAKPGLASREAKSRAEERAVAGSERREFHGEKGVDWEYIAHRYAGS